MTCALTYLLAFTCEMKSTRSAPSRMGRGAFNLTICVSQRCQFLTAIGTGREPYIELERARKNGFLVYLIGVELQSNASEQLAFAIPMTGGKVLQRPAHDRRRTMGKKGGFRRLRKSVARPPAVPLLELDAGE